MESVPNDLADVVEMVSKEITDEVLLVSGRRGAVLQSALKCMNRSVFSPNKIYANPNPKSVLIQNTMQFPVCLSWWMSMRSPLVILNSSITCRVVEPNSLINYIKILRQQANIPTPLCEEDWYILPRNSIDIRRSHILDETFREMKKTWFSSNRLLKVYYELSTIAVESCVHACAQQYYVFGLDWGCLPIITACSLNIGCRLYHAHHALNISPWSKDTMIPTTEPS